ncbi:MAG: MBL fold metallo-hydrolase [Pseudomonadota bacterium]
MKTPVRRALIPILATLLWATAAWGGPADPFAGVEIKAQQVADNIYMLSGRGGNIGASIGADGTMIIDNQFAPLADKISAALKDLGGDQPRIILNTHYHGDHTGGNPAFGAQGTIIAHHNVRMRLLNAEDFPQAGLPLVTYGENVTIHFNGDTIELLHLPTGHTDGDSIVWFKNANVVHMGDHFFKNRFPYVDVPGGGSVDGFVKNVEGVLKMLPDDAKVIPGHGTLSSPADLRQTIDAVKASVAFIRAGLSAGKAAEAISAELGEKFPGMGGGFINEARWVSIVASDT